MYDLVRRRVLALLKVPPEPQPPFGNPASLRVFRAGRNYYRLRMFTWAVAQVLALGALLFWTAILLAVESQIRDPQDAPATVTSSAAAPAAPSPGAAPANESTQPDAPGKNWVERAADRIKAAAEDVPGKDPTTRPRGIGGWLEGYKRFFVELFLMLPPWVLPLVWALKIVSYIVYFVQLPITYAVRRLDYEMRWYMVTDRSLRLRHGVWKVTESTMSFANVQQVMMTRGPVQRLLGLADVKVQSAGGGRSARHELPKGDDDMHLGMFRHVTNALEIRDLILERLRRYRESGLGDPDDQPVANDLPVAPSASPALVAAQDLLAEARALREVLD